ncbi:hypothetical protein [Maritimibacter sp. UBA3975]|uniref:hypothetical protein n=1 Tax=Maritimibacter sp. UBA3975 TaxID=1946833 RepID=UPI000C09BE9F|nr:hypothetical protein [Maritimibacter sp. UBA3975]MAM60146.1 hypothetical protein [Maritimibacter sp.]|tara:strand:- start:35144 stop:36127 length:984 start_codon:yes stop_codon:yes gene_type:complete
MLTRFKQTLYRDRKRLVFSATLILLATLVGYDFVPDVAPGLPSEAVVALAIICALPLVTRYLPKQRHAVELAALANLIFVVIGRVFPASNFNLANPEVNLISATILYLVVIALTAGLTLGRWSDRVLKPRRMRLRAHGYSQLSPRELWYGLVPTPGHLDECAEPEVVSIEYTDATRRHIRMIHWLPPHRRFESLVEIKEMDLMRSVTMLYSFSGTEREDPASEGLTTFRIIDEGRRRRIELDHVMTALPLRRALRGYLDDTLGRMMDRRLLLIERAALRARHSSRAAARAASGRRELFDAIGYQPERPPGKERRRAFPSLGSLSARG